LKWVLPAGWIDRYKHWRLRLMRWRLGLGLDADHAATDLPERRLRQELQRTELVLEQLHREIEALSARHGSELRELRAEIATLASAVEMLQASIGALASTPSHQVPRESAPDPDHPPADF
jgi:hypothetical protein